MTACWGGLWGGGSVEPPALVLSTLPWPKAPPTNLKGPEESPLNPLMLPPPPPHQRVFRKHDIILCTKEAGAGVSMDLFVKMCAFVFSAYQPHKMNVPVFHRPAAS